MPSDSVMRRVRHHRKLLMQFTSQSFDYLTNPLEKAKPIKNGMKDKTLAVGDIVFVKEQGTARCWWRMAKIE